MTFDLQRLLTLHQLARQDGKRFPRRRSLYGQVAGASGRAFVGIVGPRGVGKTVLLRQIAAEDEASFYLSADTLGQADLFEVARRLRERAGIERVLIDEIHAYPGFPAALKQIFDFLDVRVVFTGSVALSLLDASQDLSRRARLLTLWPFSYREYLELTLDLRLEQLSLQDILERRWSREHLLCAPQFSDYLQGGLLPLSLEEVEVLPLLQGVLQRIVREDIPRVAPLRVDELPRIEQTLRFVGRSTVDGINYSSISRNVGLTKYKAQSYVSLLERAFVLRRVMPAGSNVMREPKVVMAPPYRLLYREPADALGGLREDFAVQALAMAGVEFSYLKSTRGSKTPDYLVSGSFGNLALEVGGKGKGRSQFKGVSVDRKLLFVQDSQDIRTEGPYRPLHLLGFLS